MQLMFLIVFIWEIFWRVRGGQEWACVSNLGGSICKNGKIWSWVLNPLNNSCWQRKEETVGPIREDISSAIEWLNLSNNDWQREWLCESLSAVHSALLLVSCPIWFVLFLMILKMIYFCYFYSFFPEMFVKDLRGRQRWCREMAEGSSSIYHVISKAQISIIRTWYSTRQKWGGGRMVIAVFSNNSSPSELTFTVLEECLFIDFLLMICLWNLMKGG